MAWLIVAGIALMGHVEIALTMALFLMLIERL